ncbi:MAG: cytochrome c [Chloroflexi bacterium]|nr:cytochrome c [Chloroflexota bacterium]
MCHGVNFEGSDIAPTVAGTKLTDEQIAHQMRQPRGVMPAFGANDFPDPQAAISYIRAQPTGKPTLALSDQQRSAALALIAGVAAARATEYARSASNAMTPIAPRAIATTSAATAASIPSATPFATTGAFAQIKSAQTENSMGMNMFVAIGGLLAATTVGAFWFNRARR